MRHQAAILSLICSIPLAASVGAQAPMRVAPSGRGTTEVTITLVDSAARAAAKPSMIRLEYGQPNLRGRKLLTDSLVPYDKAWRTGANGATMLTTDLDLMIGGMSVPKGKYVVQTMPTRAGWKLLIQKDAAQSPMAAAMTYNPANDIARVDLKMTTLPVPLETLSMWLVPSRDAGSPHGQLVLSWGTVSLATDWTVK